MGYKIQQNQIEDLVVDLRDIRGSITGLEEELTDLIAETGATALAELSATGDYIISLIEATGSNLELDIDNLRIDFEDFTGNGTAYDSDRLNGEDASYYLNSANHTGIIPSGNLPNTTVTPGTYINATVSVDQKGRVTGISSGSGGAGDMLKSTYDTDNDGVVDNSEALNGQPASYYRNAANLTGTVGTGQLGAADSRYLKLDGGGTVDGQIVLNNGSFFVNTADPTIEINSIGSLSSSPIVTFSTDDGRTGDLANLRVKDNINEYYYSQIVTSNINDKKGRLTIKISDDNGDPQNVVQFNHDQSTNFHGDILVDGNISGNGNLITGIDGINITGKIPSGVIPDTSVTPGTYTLSTITVDSAGRIINASNGSGGAGDMSKSVYDIDDNGVVDNSERLGGELPSYYRNANNLTGQASTGILTGALENYIKFSGNIQTQILDTFTFDQSQNFNSAYFANGLSSSGTIESNAGLSLLTTPILSFYGPQDEPSYPTTVGQIDFTDVTPTGLLSQNAQILVDAVDSLNGRMTIKVSDSGGILQEVIKIESDGVIRAPNGFSGDGSLLTNVAGTLTTGQQYITGEKIFVNNFEIEKTSPTLTLTDTTNDNYAEHNKTDKEYSIAHKTTTPGLGLTFDGVNDYVDIGSSQLINTASAFSISARVYLSSFVDPYPTIISCNSNIAGLWRILFTNDASYQSICFGHNSASWGRFKSSAIFTSTNITAKDIHVTITYNGLGATLLANYALYVNGMPSDLAAAGSFGALSGNNLIGATAIASTDEKWNGRISQVCIWNDERTSQEVLDEYLNGVDSSNANLVHYWKISEGSGSSISDSGTSPITGTISGATWSGSDAYQESIPFISKPGAIPSEKGTHTFGDADGNTIIRGSRVSFLERISSNDLVAEINDGQFRFKDGLVTYPSIASRTNYANGFYFTSSTINAAISGVNKLTLNSSGLGINCTAADNLSIAALSTDATLAFKYSSSYGRSLITAAFSSSSQNSNSLSFGINQTGGTPTTALTIIGNLRATFFGGITMSSTNALALGTTTSTSAPALCFSDDANCGIGHPAGDTLTMSTNGIEYVRLNSSGNLGVGTGATISAKLHTISTTEQLRLGYDASNYLSVTVSSAGAVTLNATGASAGFTFSDSITLDDAKNISFNTTTGTKIGTSTSQKIGLWNATPIAQPTTGIAAATFVANTSSIVDDTATWGGYTIGQVVQALRNIGALA